MDCSNEKCQRLLDAAVALLEARTNQMVTAAEWNALRHAVNACGGVDPTADNDKD